MTTRARRRPALLLLAAAAGLAASTSRPASAQREDSPAALVPARPGSAAFDALAARLRAGGVVLYLRHAATDGMPCDRTFRVGDREGQRNLSPEGRAQAAALGPALAALGVPVARPVLAGPVFRARDTAELAFGAEAVRVIDELLADDYAGGRLAWVLDAHRALLSAPVPPGEVRVLVGHRTPAIMVAGPRLGGRALPEGSGAVVAPLGGSRFEVLGVLAPVPAPGGGFHGC